MILVVVPMMAQTHTFKIRMIFMATVGLLLFGMSPSLTLRSTRYYLRVKYESKMRSTNMVYSEEYDVLTIQSWNFWKTSDRFI